MTAWSQRSEPLTAAQIDARLETLELTGSLANGSATVMDSLVVDNYQAAAWWVCLTKGTARLWALVSAYHDGTSSSDATAATYSAEGPDDAGTVDVVLSCDVNGAGAAQVMRLLATASSSGWTFYSWRVPQKPAQT